jgi:acetyl esterase/lipase
LRSETYLKRCLTAVILCVSVVFAAAQPTSIKPIKLWPKGAPGSQANPAPEAVRLTPEGEHVISNVQQPSVTPYLPEPGTATGAAVIIAPGGGHSELWIDHEGYNVAEWLRTRGVAGFVLKYRLARGKGSTYTVEGTELGDIQRAIRTVRSRSKEWGIDPNRVGVMGFSAGGELAALASTRYDAGLPSSSDPVEIWSSKPNFQALLYPAIPHDPRITADTPPAFLACGGEDRPDISQGLPELYLAFSRVHVSAELHVYAGVGHGFGMRKSNPAAVSGWTSLFLEWMGAQGLLKH